MKKDPLTIGAFAIVLNAKGHVLISLRCDYPVWNLPGGKVEDGETSEMAVIREIKDLIGIYSKPEILDIVFLYSCIVTGGKLVLTDEACEHRYCHGGELPENIKPRHRERILDYFTRKPGDPVVQKKQTSGCLIPVRD